MAMTPLASAPIAELSRLRGLFFDLDDTLLTHGVLTRAAYGALWDLRDAGVRLVAVTGRPSGWGEVIVRQWPIDGVVAENGAIALLRQTGAGAGGSGGVIRRDGCDETERQRRRMQLGDLVARARTVVPEARLTDDVHARVSDVTWDIGERMRLPADRVDLLAKMIVDAGARTTRSSVHLHASFDVEDKASGAVAFAQAVFGEDSGATLASYAFIGDSGNDAACFGAFRTTFGVANVASWVPRLSVVPRYVSEGARGEGFAEVAAALIQARGVVSRRSGLPR
jgi:hydroxymethylpyrimidine pyrophosphatase-like HAD family hydrolase